MARVQVKAADQRLKALSGDNFAHMPAGREHGVDAARSKWLAVNEDLHARGGGIYREDATLLILKFRHHPLLLPIIHMYTPGHRRVSPPENRDHIRAGSE